MFILVNQFKGVAFPEGVIREKLAGMINRLNAGEEIETIGQPELVLGLQEAVKTRMVKVPLTFVHDGKFFSVFQDGRCGLFDEYPSFGALVDELKRSLAQ